MRCESLLECVDGKKVRHRLPNIGFAPLPKVIGGLSEHGEATSKSYAIGTTGAKNVTLSRPLLSSGTGFCQGDGAIRLGVRDGAAAQPPACNQPQPLEGSRADRYPCACCPATADRRGGGRP